MDISCSPTWFLIFALLSWALISFLALVAEPYASREDRLPFAPRRASRSRRSPGLHMAGARAPLSRGKLLIEREREA